MNEMDSASLNAIAWELKRARWDREKKPKVKKVYRDRYIDMDAMLRDCQSELASGVQEVMR